MSSRDPPPRSAALPPASPAPSAGPAPGERLVCETAGDTIAAGRQLARRLLASSAGTPPVLALTGPLAAGKTTLVKGVALELGVTEPITSPTFALVSQYQLAGGTDFLTHVDLYRIDSEAAVESLALDDMLSVSRLMVIEWAEKAPGAIPIATLSVQIDVRADGKRRLEIFRQ